MKKNTYILIIIFVLLLILTTLIYKHQTKSNTTKDETKTEYILLEDYSQFFTVNSCIYKYINFLQNENYTDLFKVLNKDFINNNNINENNIYNFLPNISNKNYSYVSKKIYYTKINKNITKYYVYGYLINDSIDNNNEKEYYSYIVCLNSEKLTFNIEPYVGNLFAED